MSNKPSTWLRKWCKDHGTTWGEIRQFSRLLAKQRIATKNNDTATIAEAEREIAAMDEARMKRLAKSAASR